MCHQSVMIRPYRMCHVPVAAEVVSGSRRDFAANCVRSLCAAAVQPFMEIPDLLAVREDRDLCLDFDGDLEWERDHAHGRTGMTAHLGTEHVEDQI